VVDVEAALVAAADEGQDGWAAPRLLGRVAPVCALVADTASRIRSVCLVTGKSVPGVECG
jgi:hypothetical protein